VVGEQIRSFRGLQTDGKASTRREENSYSGRNYPELEGASREEVKETSLIAALDGARILSTALASPI